MRNMPQLTPGAQSIQMTSAWRGYNHNEIIADGEMYDMQNLSGDRYPILTPRQKRGIRSFDPAGATPVPLTGIHGRDQLVYIRGTKVYYNLAEVSGISVSTAESMVPKKIVSFGAYVCIWPDKVYFNTVDESDKGSMERTWTESGSDIELTMCRGDGTDYDMTEIAKQDDPPADPENGKLWIDTSGINDVLMQWDSITMEWSEVATTYVKVTSPGIGTGLKELDAISISGMEAADGSEEKIQAQVDDLNGSKTVWNAGDNYIVITGLISESQEALASGDVHADMLLPDLDYVCESNNRLWGCHYGLDAEGNVVNEIRASKLGDFRNWYCFLGISTDSYAVTVGTDGVFTGAITQRGYPVFFKENAIHRVSGQTPSSFSVQTTIARGVQKGSWRSLCVVNENIYYKARQAVMLYDGNMPISVSEQLGNVLYSDARAGVLGSKYYISMRDSVGNWRLFNYDTEHGTWYKEDNTKALGFGTVDDELYFIDEVNNTLVSVRGSFGDIEPDFDWAAEFGLMGVNYVQGGSGDSPARIRNAKYLSMFKIRMYLDPASSMKLWIKYNDNALYEEMGERRGNQMRTFVLPVIPKRCDHLRFKITGHGDMKVYDLSRLMEVGGDG